MEHFFTFGLAAVAFGSLLLTVGPRIIQKSGNSYSPPYSDKGLKKGKR